jgi:hypothetical protein
MDLFDDESPGDGLHTWPTPLLYGSQTDVSRPHHLQIQTPIGEVLGSRYEVGAEIGSGASAITYTVVNLVDQGGFSVPPYVLLAGGTLTIQVRNPA